MMELTAFTSDSDAPIGPPDECDRFRDVSITDPISRTQTDPLPFFSRHPPDYRLARILEAIEHPARPSALPVSAGGSELCVVASSAGVFASRFASVKKDATQLCRMHYRGFRQSPFLPLPRRLSKWIAQWCKFCDKRPVLVESGSEPVRKCYICAAMVDDPIAHHESEGHRRRCEALTEWDLFDQLKAELEAQFSQERPI
jgi:hypothetical protein